MLVLSFPNHPDSKMNLSLSIFLLWQAFKLSLLLGQERDQCSFSQLPEVDIAVDTIIEVNYISEKFESQASE